MIGLLGAQAAKQAEAGVTCSVGEASTEAASELISQPTLVQRPQG